VHKEGRDKDIVHSGNQSRENTSRNGNEMQRRGRTNKKDIKVFNDFLERMLDLSLVGGNSHV